MNRRRTWLVLTTSQDIATLAPQEQVATLLSLARENDLDLAFQVARFLKNPLVLRAFYDSLTQVYFSELRRQGKLPELI